MHNQPLLYQFQPAHIVLRHFPAFQPQAKDQSESEIEELYVQARIRSGDYLMTLATEIDTIAQSLSESNAPEAADLERLVAELTYINRKYTISNK